MEQTQQETAVSPLGQRYTTFLHAALFVLGFSLIFIVGWGGAATIPTYLIAILAGLLSFLSPCVLPLVPAYIGYLSGQAFGNDAAA